MDIVKNRPISKIKLRPTDFFLTSLKTSNFPDFLSLKLTFLNTRLLNG